MEIKTHHHESSEAQLDATHFKRTMGETYGINGSSPAERIKQLQQLSVEGVAVGASS